MIQFAELEKLRRIHAIEMSLFELRGHQVYGGLQPFSLHLRDLSRTDTAAMAEKWGVTEEAVLALIISEKLLAATVKADEDAMRRLSVQLRKLVSPR